LKKLLTLILVLLASLFLLPKFQKKGLIMSIGIGEILTFILLLIFIAVIWLWFRKKKE